MPAKVKSKQTAPKTPVYQEAVVPAEENARGAIRIASGAIATIVRRAACSVEGVTRITGNSLVDSIADFVGSKKIQDRAIQVSIRKAAVAVELSVNVAYGVSLPAVASAVQQTVAEQIGSITGLSVSQVNVIIREMEDISEAEEEE